jgi:Xaa-Pro aminopeptidase
VPEKETNARISLLQKEMKRRDMEGVLIIQRVDLYYFSGTAQNAVLFVPAEGAPLLMVKKYYPRAKAESSIEQVVEMGSIRDAPGLIRDAFGRLPCRMALELDVLPYNVAMFYRSLFPEAAFDDCSPLVLRLRSVKSPWEVEQMGRTAEVSMTVFDRLRNLLRTGITEVELSIQAEALAKRLGHEGRLRVRDFQTEGYFQHILSGESGGTVGLLDAPASGIGASPAFPCGASPRRILEGEPVMADLSMVINGYHIDETRMFSIGHMAAKARAACEGCIEIHDRVIERMRPGAVTGELFDFATDLARRLGLEEAFLGPPGYKVSFVAHGIGLELVEPPFIAAGRKEILEPGMTLALEPKCVFEGEFAAGIESVVLVTESGARPISKLPPGPFVC